MGLKECVEKLSSGVLTELLMQKVQNQGFADDSFARAEKYKLRVAEIEEALIRERKEGLSAKLETAEVALKAQLCDVRDLTEGISFRWEHDYKLAGGEATLTLRGRIRVSRRESRFDVYVDGGPVDPATGEIIRGAYVAPTFWTWWPAMRKSGGYICLGPQQEKFDRLIRNGHFVAAFGLLHAVLETIPNSTATAEAREKEFLSLVACSECKAVRMATLMEYCTCVPADQQGAVGIISPLYGFERGSVNLKARIKCDWCHELSGSITILKPALPLDQEAFTMCAKCAASTGLTCACWGCGYRFKGIWEKFQEGGAKRGCCTRKLCRRCGRIIDVAAVKAFNGFCGVECVAGIGNVEAAAILENFNKPEVYVHGKLVE